MFDRVSSFLRGDGYKARASRGSILTAINFGGQNVLRLSSNLLLTRLLFPEAFGLMALVQLVIAAAGMFADFGIRSAIVSNPRGDDPVFLNTAFTMQILRGCVLALVIFLLAEPMAQFYDEPQLAELLKLSCLVPLIGGFNSTRIFTANRELVLGRLTMLMLGSQFSGIVVMIGLAWWLESVWALAIGGVVTSLVLAVLSHVVLPGIPNRVGFEMAAAKSLFNFGKFILLGTLSTFFINQGDKAVLGKFVSLDELAIYNIGFFLAVFPVLLLAALNDQVVFPLYARRPPSDSEDNRRHINKARMLLTGFAMFSTGFVAMIGIPLIELLYDSRYQAAGPMLTLIALVTLPRLITQSYPNLALAAGHSGRFSVFLVLVAVIQLALMYFSVQAFGLVGAILTPVVAWALTYVPMIYMIRPYKGWAPLHDLLYFFIAVGIAAITLWVWYDDLAPLIGLV